MKPIVELTGILSYDLEPGFRAFIQETNGKRIMTSLVVSVRNETADGVEFETKNTIYKLTYAKEMAA